MGIPAKARDKKNINTLKLLDRTIVRTAKIIAWLNLLLVGVILTQIVLRYGFHHGLVALEELLWHLYATVFLFSMSLALVTDRHVRVDVLQAQMSARSRQIIEIAGILCLLLPMLVIILDHSMDWVASSYRFSETSENPTGLPYRWLLKAMIPISTGMLIIASISRLLQQALLLFGNTNSGD